jgi:hypothetical protein
VHSGRQSSPFHVEVDEEEIFFVLAGSGFFRQGDATYEIRAGDCIVRRVAEEPHTLVGGDDGLDFGERTNPTLTWLPWPRIARDGISFPSTRSAKNHLISRASRGSARADPRRAKIPKGGRFAAAAVTSSGRPSG